MLSTSLEGRALAATCQTSLAQAAIAGASDDAEAAKKLSPLSCPTRMPNCRRSKPHYDKTRAFTHLMMQQLLAGRTTLT